MKKVLVFTITRNRLETFKKYYHTFRDKNKTPGVEFCYLIIDNGSDKEMREHLTTLAKDTQLFFNPVNEGITWAWLRALRWAKENGFNFDYFVKLDPDILVEQEGLLHKYIQVSRLYGDKYIATPVDLNIHKDYIPRNLGVRRLFTLLNNKEPRLPFLLTTHIGSACSFYSKRAMKEFELEINTPKGDMERGIFFRKKGFEVGYFETLSMSHMGVVPEAKNYPPEKYIY